MGIVRASDDSCNNAPDAGSLTPVLVCFPMDNLDDLEPAAAPTEPAELAESAEPDAPPEPRPKAPPIHSRFLFVDVAAMRAKQLRRGSLPRLDDDPHSSEAHRPDPHKPERVAMEEVRRGLVLYDVVPVTEDAG